MNKEDLGYIPKKGRAAFVQTRTTFVKATGVLFVKIIKILVMMRKTAQTRKLYPLILDMFFSRILKVVLVLNLLGYL